MRVTWCLLAVCLVGVASGGEPQGNRHRRSAGVYLSITGEKPQGKNNVASPVLPVQLPIQLGGQGGVTLPVLVVPVPVYTSGADKCEAHQHGGASEDGSIDLSPHRPAAPPRQPPYVAIRGGPSESTGSQQHAQPINFNQFNQQLQDPQAYEHQKPVNDIISSISGGYQGQNGQPIHHAHVAPSKDKFNFNYGTDSHAHYGVGADSSVPISDPQANFGVDFSAPAPEQEATSYSGSINQVFATSAEMVQSFIRQAPVAPELPAVIPEGVSPERLPVEAPASDAETPIAAAPPPVPRFARSLQLRIDLNVPRADYTEAFQLEWHADSQTCRTVVEDGTTTFYRAPLPDGRVQFLEMRVDRSGEAPVRRCTLSPLMAPPESDLVPGLPDMELFQFIGYTTAEGQSQVERWQRTVRPGAGRGGAAPGEQLTVYHEMLLTRDNGEAVPLRYTVVTDSSVLGPAADSYVQRYRVGAAPAAAARPEPARDCDSLEELPAPAEHAEHVEHADVRARFDPLREFALPTRDERYDTVFKKYKSQFQRKYLDVAEEAVRKTLLTQHSRFVSAGNRLASTFELAVNFLADRLDDELAPLFGVAPPRDGAGDAGLVPFPYSDADVDDISSGLPDEFDWRPRGAVSPVRFQETTCASCWAFAVAGATEGALFKKTGRLVPLSPQCLVDCGRPYGTNGCQGTWPNFAYDYVQARGLPAWDEYTNYQAKVLQCKDQTVPPVTHISGHVNVTANNPSALKVAIRKNGPNVVIVDAKAKSFILYSKGVLKDQRCGQNRPALNHAVLAVGWGKRDGEHFIIKNSWSARWGEQGYVRVHPGSCALLQRPSYPIVTDPDIDRPELRAAAASVQDD